MTFNLPNVSSLNLTFATIAAIYEGHVTRWNSSAIQRWNPDVHLPSSAIHVISCAGTCSVSGSLSVLSRPAEGVEETRVPTDSAVVHGVKTTPYSAGFVHLPDAVEGRLSYAIVADRWGRPQSPSDVVESALGTTTNSSSVRVNTTNPFVTFISYVVTLDDPGTCEAAVELYGYVRWITRDPLARRGCLGLRFVPLSSRLRDVIDERVLERLTCGGGRRRRVSDIARAQTLADSAALLVADWKAVLLWIFGAFTGLCALLLARTVWLHLRTLEAMWTTDWRISLEQVTFSSDIKHFRSSVHPTDGRRGSQPSLGDVGDKRGRSPSNVSTTGTFRGQNVTLRPCRRVPSVRLTLATRKLLLWMRDNVCNANVLHFYGVVERRSRSYIVSEQCDKGQLRDVIHDPKYHLNDNFKFSMSCDIATGVAYLHSRDIVHGCLSPSCCFIDARWTVKIGDWEFHKLERVQGQRVLLHWQAANSGMCDEDRMAAERFYTSPELLQSSHAASPSRQADAYSYAILMIEIFSRKPPFWLQRDTMKPSEILSEVRGQRRHDRRTELCKTYLR